jgi:hypothetical protein
VLFVEIRSEECENDLQSAEELLLLLLLFITANGFSPGGSGTTIRHNTQITHITQNNTTHKSTHTIHRMNTT